MHPWAMLSGGPGSGIQVTRDGGATWTRVTQSGLPKSPVGKVDVAIAPSDSSRVYALIQTADQGSLWRSDDGGRAWKVVSWDRALIGRAGYYVRLGISPVDADEVLVANSSSHRSTDGGVTFQPWGGCGDCHDIWFDPKNADRFAMTDDAGMQITTNHGQSLQRIRLPIGQMYHVAVDNQVPYYIYSNMQDNGTMRGPSNSPEAVANNARGASPPEGGRGGGGGGRGGAVVPWDHVLGGCESGFTVPDPSEPGHRVGLLLREQADAVRREAGDRALDRAVDDFSRLAANRHQVPLPLDRAARSRSVRSENRRTTAAR